MMRSSEPSLGDALGRLWAAEAPLLVIGDLMIDRYIWGDARRISPEAPVAVLSAEHQEERLGGAANVAGALRNLELRTDAVGTVGADQDGEALLALMKGAGIGVDGVLKDPSRRTTSKERLIGHAAGHQPQQILRVDREIAAPLSAVAAAQVRERAAGLAQQAGALLFADYAKGVCVPELVRPLIALARRQRIPTLVDPPLGCDWTAYHGATVLKPNRREAESALGTRIPDAQAGLAAAVGLHQRFGADAVFLTLDREGLVIATAEGSRHLPAEVRRVFDITGAGDMAMAILGAGLAAGLPWDVLGRLANEAAGVAVEAFGNATIRRAHLAAAIGALRQSRKTLDLDALAERLAAHRARGQRVVLTNGCFDLVHPGHIACLEECAAAGDILVVAVNDDAGVRRLKGPHRPICSLVDRLGMLEALECVDYLVAFEGETPNHLIARLRPDVLAKGGTTSLVIGRELVEAYGGQVLLTRAAEGWSTTALLGRLMKRADPES